MFNKITWTGLFSVLALGLPAQAAIVGTYVDATTGNTTHSDGFSTWNGGPSDTDNLWQYRSDGATAGAVNGDVWESGADGEDSAMIKTTLTGLNPLHEYDIYIIFYAKDDSTWYTYAGLSPSPLSGYTHANSTQTGTVTGGSIYQLQHLVGTVSGVSSVDAYIDDFVSTGGPLGATDRRAWYDGISYVDQGPVPEPASLALTGLGGLLLVARKRRD